MPVAWPTIKPKKCGRLPGAGEPKLACVGFALSHETNSGTVFAGLLGATANANWYVATCDTGAKSFAGFVVELLEHERREHGHHHRREQQSGSVCGRVFQRLGGDSAARADPILDHDRLA